MELHIHHIEFGVDNFESINHKFEKQFRFILCARRETDAVVQSLWCHNNLQFITTKFKNCINNALEYDDEYAIHLCDVRRGNSSQLNAKSSSDIIESVHNVAFRVNDINACLDHIKKHGGTLLRPIKHISDDYGFIKLAVVKSCLGNVIHTLIDFSNYNGLFMPQFHILNEQYLKRKEPKETYVTNITGMDHLAFAINAGNSEYVIDWYKKCFNMQRYLVNSTDSITDGLVVKIGNGGVRLKSMQYEVGVMTNDESIKFVLAESLDVNGSDQISTFIREHGGEGLQHIGLTTDNIVECISILSSNGVQFTEPPPTYYSEIGKLADIEAMGEDGEALSKHGILIDADTETPNSYIMQKFTKPIFGVNTFFFEVIQRRGSRGFGVGNVKALWKSFQAYLEQTQKPTALE